MPRRSSRHTSAGATDGSIAPESCSCRPAYCFPRKAAGSVRCARSNAPALALRSRAAAAAPGRSADSISLRRHHELVDDDLRAVDEIAELRFPHHQRQRIGHAIAELKAHHGEFAQRAVKDLEIAPGPARCAGAEVAFARLVVVESRWRWLKVPRPRILAAQPHRRAFQHQAAEGQRLGKAPVDRARRLQNAFAALLDEAASVSDAGGIFRETRERLSTTCPASRGLPRSRGQKLRDLLVRHRAQFLRPRSARAFFCASS